MPTNIKNPPIPKRRPDSFAMPLVDDAFRAFVKKHEGVVDHLYKDHKGNITTGAGFHVSERKVARKLGFYHTDGRRATPKEIDDAYSRLKKRPNGNFSAKVFDPSRRENKDLLNIRMREQDIDRELDTRLNSMEDELRAKIPRFDTIPRAGRKALLDMQYNMGDDRFKGKGWPKFYEALDNRDWAGAAAESGRKDVSNERNQAIRNWLLDADRKEKEREGY